ncbi:MAG: ABC transporter permease [Alphaproteobacteria bacterium]|nr:ABC transporter permease [Alphaproteobacteria bacterium]
MAAGGFSTSQERGGWVLRGGGRWDVEHSAALDAALRALEPAGMRSLSFRLGEIERLDTAGAWLLHRTLRQLAAAGIACDLAELRPEHQAMLEQVAIGDRPAPAVPEPLPPLLAVIARLGRGALDVRREAEQLLGFFGAVSAGLLRTIVQPRRLRFTSFVFHLERVGLNALPIVGLISFLIGVVLAYQGAVQLQRFGAQVFVVNLIGVSVLREIGILLTAIVVAGRSGSAFAAQIGSMMVHQEVDAMRTLGLDPMDMLVLPRILALVIALPLLCFYADLMGLLGGGMMAWLVLDISPGLFIERLNQSVTVWSFLVGMIKAPVFGFVIGLIGCLEGLRVGGSAESVGRQTTRAVVAAIFLVIVLDAVFSIFFSLVGV